MNQVLDCVSPDADDEVYDALYSYGDPSPGDGEEEGEWDEGRDVRLHVPYLPRVSSGDLVCELHSGVRRGVTWMCQQHVTSE